MDLTARTVARILKVNHAGECAAIGIYRAQLRLSRRLYPDLVAFLSETLTHEIDHRRRFREAMPARRTWPCGAMPLWGAGGYALGLITALMGRNAIMVCTKAVEQTVHRHLGEQIHYLAGRDDALRDLILTIQVEENAHLAFASCHIVPSSLNGALEGFITMATEAVIWLSTQGAVSRMERALRHG